MTNRETLLALADRFEKATGESFGLFAEAFEAVNGGRSSERLAWSSFCSLIEAEAWLDAAMTLAKDFGGEVTFFKDGTAKAYLWQPYPLAVECKKAATPALALCAASLRALATLDPTGEKA